MNKISPKAPVGVLLVNLGSPLSFSPQSIRTFLRAFLSDPLVIDYPRWLWWPILHFFILRKRPKRLSKKYQSIWKLGSPLHTFSIAQQKKLAILLGDTYIVELAMRYGCPCIKGAANRLYAQGVQNMVVLPLYPQYSITTTKTVERAIDEYMKTTQMNMKLLQAGAYFNHPDYIRALLESISNSDFCAQDNQLLLFSFHSIPKRYEKKDTSYQKQCLATAYEVANALHLSPKHYQIGFQSTFGPEKWLGPKSDTIVANAPRLGVQQLFVVAPGFSVDCLETLEEINIEMKKTFLQAGGKSFHYIACLNDQVDFLASIIKEKLDHAQ